jgi:peptide deformylase
MILPIYAYGQAVLKKPALEIEENSPELQELIANMWETMHKAEGVGLAAPQIGLLIRLFIVDTSEVIEEENGKAEEESIKKVFINPQIIEETGTPGTYEEGCLSIPDIRGDVERPPLLKLRYLDENFEAHETVFEGINARVVQHEYDHLEGILFTDLLKPIKKRLIKKKLEKIKKGDIEVAYRMKFPKQKSRVK